MRNLYLFLSCLLVQTGFAQSKSERAVLDAEQRRFEAMTRKDTVSLRDMLADDLVYVHSNTVTETKKEHISAISSGQIVYAKMTREQARVRRYGKTAICNGTVQVQGILRDASFEIKLLYTAVYRKKGGKWRLVNWQSTRVP